MLPNGPPPPTPTVQVWFAEMMTGLVKKNRETYVRNTFQRLRDQLSDVDKTKFKYQAGGKLLTLECGREVRGGPGGAKRGTLCSTAQ